MIENILTNLQPVYNLLNCYDFSPIINSASEIYASLHSSLENITKNVFSGIRNTYDGNDTRERSESDKFSDWDDGDPVLNTIIGVGGLLFAGGVTWLSMRRIKQGYKNEVREQDKN